MDIKDIPQVHLDGVLVRSLTISQPIKRIKNGNRVHYVPGRKIAKINGKRVPLRIAQNILEVCLENGVLPHLEC